ncbi:MAG: universal stress protein [Rhodocyclaceae bacterium]
MYKNLFVPVDGGELSARAMDGSLELAAQLGARVTGFVVEPDLPLSVTTDDAATFAERVSSHQASNASHARALLEEFESRAAKAGVEFTGISVTGYSIDGAIANEAARHGCDMIVIVTHGRGPLGELVFGSHTKKVISRTRLPVLVLH